jgi:hypothetical protein
MLKLLHNSLKKLHYSHYRKLKDFLIFNQKLSILLLSEMFKILYFPFVFFCLFYCLKGSEIPAFFCFRVYFNGINAVSTGF